MMKGKEESANDEGNDEKGAVGPESSMLSLRENLENLTQLQKVHEERLQLCQTEISQLKKFRSDYLNLQKRLKTLPDKTTHEVMVPFGSLAFMPGRLIHTNEILVLLGDNWFAERSVKQAVEIVKRRLKDCDEKIKTAESTEKIHLNWLKETRELLENDVAGQVDIVEKMTEEEYQRSKEEHRKSVAKEYSAVREKTFSSGSSDIDLPNAGDVYQNLSEEDKRTYEDIMKRLDELELEEENDTQSEDEEEDEDLNEEDVEEEEEEVPMFDSRVREEPKLIEAAALEEEVQQSSAVIPKKREKLKRRVSWADDIKPLETIIPDNDSEDIFRIQYSSLSPAEEGGEGASGISGAEGERDGSQKVRSPSDIYKIFGATGTSHEVHPRGILKKSSSFPLQGESETNNKGGWRYAPESVEIVNEDVDDLPLPRPLRPSPPLRRKSLQPAFSYKVVERTTESEERSETLPGATALPDSDVGSQPKKISKFKASRMKK